MNVKTRQALVAASVAGLLAAAGGAGFGRQGQADDTKDGPCYGINKCKGTGDCGGKGHTCAGKNACAGQGYLKLNKETCLKIKDGRLTQEPAATKS